ncbi:MAG TPA: glycosyltransferase family 39 protein [Patescibacteria group bacterium]|nr:glycosyltransferase family 39 protein [Patescibacteria group bacterium]
MKNKLLYKIIFLFIFFLAAAFRFYDINWDQGYHLHPDERAIVMYSLPLQWPSTIRQFFSVSSPWNPHFFAYGSFPLYFLKFLGSVFSLISLQLAGYDGINLVGRAASGFFDLGTLVCIFLLGRKLKNVKVGLLASFFYAVSVLPIQLSHFYAVDTTLTFFLTLILYICILFYEKPSFKKSLGIGILLGFAFATKISATVILVSLAAALVADFGLLIIKHPLHPYRWVIHVPRFLFSLIRDVSVIAVVGIAIYAILEPYAFIDFPEFWQQTLAQSAMTKSAFTFPYTLQYVGIIPYWYEIKNIFLWGLGPILASIGFMGIVYGSFICIKRFIITPTSPPSLLELRRTLWAQELILIVFFWAYFLTVGRFAVGFMRYMLPLYPLFCLFGAMVVYSVILNLFQDLSRFRIKSGMTNFLFIVFCLLFFAFLLVWPLSFMHIYSASNTRVLATNYINQNIPAGEGLAVEHWDDELPLSTAGNYKVQTLALYDPDTIEKWQTIVQQLQTTDYIIIASNRLYVPIQKLNNCSKYPDPHCYPVASIYYKNLFSGLPVLQNTEFVNLPGASQLVFKQVAQFLVSPQIPVLNIPINDQKADESFTVYDHPKVMIFKKIGNEK